MRFALTLLACGLVPSSALACPTGDAWVRVRLTGDWPPADRDSVLADLRAELDGRSIEVCDEAPDGDPAAPPLAEVALERPTDAQVSVSILVHDEVTDKRVGRDVSLEDVPEAGRPLTIALAVVELLRASWLELRMRDRPEPDAPVPAPVQRAIEEEELEPLRPRPPQASLGAQLIFEHATGGVTQLGGELRYLHWPIDELAVGVRVGGRGALTLSSDRGSVRPAVFGAGLDLRVALTPRLEVFYVGLEASALLMVVHFDAEGAAPVVGNATTDVALSVRGAVVGRVRLVDALGLELSLGAGAPVIALVATDGEAPLGGVADLELIAAAGLVLEL